MSAVVSDTSPIRALAHLERLDLIRDLFGSMIVPPSVVQELRYPRWSTLALDVEQVPFASVRAPQDRGRVEALRALLDTGEAEAIVLALEVHPEALLMDEREGRAIARQLGLRPLGVLGLLLRAKERALIEEVTPLVDRLRDELRFFVSDELREEVRQLARE